MKSLQPRRPGYGAAFLIAAVFFGAIAPTLSWIEFSGGGENLVIGAVVEMRRGGPVLVPNLQGQPRIKKPPWPTWVAAAGVSDQTMRGLNNLDQTARDAAFRRLAWETRWPSLLSSCLMLVAVYALGRLVSGPKVGLVAALVCGSTGLFFRFGRAATTDVQLALWVTVANAFLAAALFRGRTTLGFIGAGAALGLGCMSKGPAIFIQTLLPFAAFFLWRRFDPAPVPKSEVASIPFRWRPVLIGLALMLAIVLPWVLAVIVQRPNVLAEWKMEITRKGATELEPDPWYVYFNFFGWVLPWSAWFIAGVVIAVQRMLGQKQPTPFDAEAFYASVETSHDPTEKPPPLPGKAGMVLSLCLVFVPLLVMSFLKDKSERYMFPMVAGAAVLIAQAFVGWVEAGRPHDVGARIVRVGHWLAVGALALIGPLGAVFWLRTPEGEPGVSLATGIFMAGVGLAIVVAGYLLSRRFPYATVATAAVMLLVVQYPVVWAYGHSAQGRAEFKPLVDRVWAEAPDAEFYEYDLSGRGRVYSDLPIYLNRIVYKTSDPASLPRKDRPQALAVFERRSGADVSLPPPWRLIGTGGAGKSEWRLYLLPAE